MRALTTGLAIVVAISLTGCSAAAVTSNGSNVDGSVSAKMPENAPAPTPRDVVSFLSSHCSGAAGSIILVPSAWMPIGAGTAAGSKLFQLDLSGSEDWDPSYIVAVDMTPTASGFEFSMPDEFLQDTNYEMSVWGCDFAADPNAGTGTSGDGGGEAPAANMQSMPDLYGLSGDTVQQDVWGAGYQFHVVREFTTFNPPSDCQAGVSGVGMVVAQSVSAGSSFEDSSSYTVRVTIDCDYTF